MAFENISVGSLNAALNECNRALDYNTTNTLKSSVASSTVWQCDAQATLKSALTTLADERYKELESKITNYLGIVTKIKEYKELELSVKTLKNEIERLKPNLYYKKERVLLGITYYTTVKDEAVAADIANKNQLITDNQQKMKDIEQQVAGSV